MLRERLQSVKWIVDHQTLLGKILMQYKFRKRGIRIVDLASEVSSDIVAEPPVTLGKVTVQENVHVGRHLYMVSGTLFSNVSIGRYCSIADNVLVAPYEHATNYLTTYAFSLDYSFYKEGTAKKTTIGNDVWIGANAIIRRGIKIADGAVIGAGAVVLNDVPPYSIVVGVPARVTRYRFNEETIKKLLMLKWWEIDETSLASVDFSNVEKCIEELELLGKRSLGR
jgi:acetyltransferase-like isoleucine patch superfamily enzyme